MFPTNWLSSFETRVAYGIEEQKHFAKQFELIFLREAESKLTKNYR